MIKAGIQRIPVTIAKISQESPTVRSLCLDLRGQQFTFLPGQWIDCFLSPVGSHPVAGFSMTSAPSQKDSINIAVKLVGGNPVTHYIHSDAKAGDTLYIEGGSGDFVYEKSMGGPVTLIAGGIGITPMMSIIRYIAEEAPEVTAVILYSAAAYEELVFRQELDGIASRCANIHAEYTVTRPDDESWRGHVGRIDKEMLAPHISTPETLVYVCGPPPLIDQMVPLIQCMGVPEDRLRYEKW